MQEHSEPVSVSSYGGGGFSLRNLEAKEIDKLCGAFQTGTQWVRRDEQGRIENIPALKALPCPADDIEMQPFWCKSASEEIPVQLELFRLGTGRKHDEHASPSISIQHLCGYDYTPEKYRAQAELLESFGFECLRSRRGESGQFWEVWFLSGLWAARGALREAIDVPGKRHSMRYKTRHAVAFLAQHASFGTLDISVQRLAQVLDPEY